MNDYHGCKCTACQKEFQPGDDIVVCPDCGTPYHRSCWAEIGHCLHEAEHAAGYEWKPDRPSVAEEDAEGIPCPVCKTVNPAGSRFCNNCGSPLPGSGDNNGGTSSGPRYAQQGDDSADAFASYVAARTIGPDDAIDGIKAKDWAAYIGKSVPFYLINFQQMAATGRKIAVSIAAFLFGPLYFYYRKMWKWALLFSGVFVLCNAPSVLYLLAAAGVPALSGISLSALESAVNIVAFLNWAVRFGCGMFAVYWYKQQASGAIRAICEKVPEGDQRLVALSEAGGTSMKALVLVLLVLLISMMSIVIMAGPELIAYYQSLGWM